jgi:hypothetical protein
MSKILGSDITVGTSLLWLEKVGTYYRATEETVKTVATITPIDHPSFDALMTFHNEYPRHTWFVDYSQEYPLADEYKGLSWDEGNPNNPL